MSPEQKTSIFSKVSIVTLTLILLLLYYSAHNISRDFRSNQVNLSYRLNSNSSSIQSNVLFNISNVQLNLKHFQLIELTPHSEEDRCEMNSEKGNSFLLVNTNTKVIGLQYFNLLRSLVFNQHNPKQQCINFRIFVLKQKRFLLLDQQSYLSEYSGEISAAVNQISKMTSNRLNILASEEGSSLLLESLHRLIEEGNFNRNIRSKLDKVLLINLYNDAIVSKQPIQAFIESIKQKTLQKRQTVQIFNSLNIIMINTLKKQYNLLSELNNQLLYQTQTPGKNPTSSLSNGLCIQEDQQQKQEEITNNFFLFHKLKHYQLFDQENLPSTQINNTSKVNSSQFKDDIQMNNYFILSNTTILHTRQMSNLHMEFTNGDYFHYEPFLKIITHLIKHINKHHMTLKAVEYCLRYGETNTKFPLELLSKIGIRNCILHQLHISQPTLWNTDDQCFRIKINSSLNNLAYLIYSDEGEFEMYSESLTKIAQYDKAFNKSVYLLQKINDEILLYNPNNIKINLAVGPIFSPFQPLTEVFEEFQILYMDQVDQKIFHQDQITRKLVIRACQSNNLLLFPDNFPVGKIHREFLLQKSKSQCYSETSSYLNFMSKIDDNAMLLRNLIILLLFLGFIKNRPLGQFLIHAFVSLCLILYFTDLKAYHTVFVIFIAYTIEKSLHLMCQAAECIQIDRTKVFLSMVLLLFISMICEGFSLGEYNYWKIVLIFMVFFISRENVLILVVKLYYLQQQIFYEEFEWQEIVQLVLFMYVTQLKVQESLRASTIEKVSTEAKTVLTLSLGVIIVLCPETDYFHTLVDLYIRSIIFLTAVKLIAH